MDVAGIERELAEIWTEAATGEDAVVRACMLNLVVVCKNGECDLETATKAVAGISETAPCRALVLAPDGCGSAVSWTDRPAVRGRVRKWRPCMPKESCRCMLTFAMKESWGRFSPDA